MKLPWTHETRRHPSPDKTTHSVLVCVVALVVLCLQALIALSASAQNNLNLVDSKTEVRSISFRFPDTDTFQDETLLQQLSLKQPGFKDKWFFWKKDARYPFSPVDLQKDVVRLRRFYSRNGFLEPTISYEDSEFDVDENEISIVFTIVEGPPVVIQDFGFYSPDDDYAIYLFEGDIQDRWTRFESDISLELGRRYTQLAEANIRGLVQTWMNDRGYAFADIDVATVIDSTYHTADVRFVLKPGPLTNIDSIQVEGTSSVSKNVVTRELPFSVGDRYSKSRINRGQNELQSLNLFRLVLTDLPEQDVDSTVTVRYRVREVDFRQIELETGFARSTGPTLDGNWQHRNFMGGARNFNVGFSAITGYKAAQTGNNIPPQTYSASVTLRQPYIFNRKMSGSVSPFIRFEKDTRLQQTDLFQRVYGFSTNLVYEFHSYRSTSLSYTLSRIRLPATLASTEDDLYNKSVLTFSSTIGKTDDFLNPREGWIFRPFIESAGSVFGSDVDYLKGSAEITGYVPLTRRSEFIGRAYIGHLIPLNESSDALAGNLTQSDSIRFENRFDAVMFYSGGATDVRGWADELLGAKIAREIFNSDNEFLRYAYEPIGGRSKVEASLSYRYPFPGLSSKWKLATFVDAGQVSSKIVSNNGTIAIEDTGRLSFDNIKVGAGSGIRYETLFGFVRFDIAMKLNPSDTDLISPGDLFNGIDRKRQIRRFRIHLSIGQTF